MAKKLQSQIPSSLELPLQKVMARLTHKGYNAAEGHGTFRTYDAPYGVIIFSPFQGVSVLAKSELPFSCDEIGVLKVLFPGKVFPAEGRGPGTVLLKTQEFDPRIVGVDAQVDAFIDSLVSVGRDFKTRIALSSDCTGRLRTCSSFVPELVLVDAVRDSREIQALGTTTKTGAGPRDLIANAIDTAREMLVLAIRLSEGGLKEALEPAFELVADKS